MVTIPLLGPVTAQIFQGYPDAVVVAEAGTSRIVGWNSRAEALFGLAVPEALNQPIGVLISPRDQDRLLAALGQVRETLPGVATGAQRPLELIAQRKTGEEFAVEVTLSRIGDGLDGGDFVLEVVRDLTARQQAEEERARLLRER